VRAAEVLAVVLAKHSTPGRPIESRVLVGSRYCAPLRHFRALAPSVPTSACETEVWVVCLIGLPSVC
jgi:hypothetical protein